MVRRRAGGRGRSRTLVAVGLAAGLTAGMALTGCGDVAPGAAATVDGTTIPLDTVDELASSVCAAEVTFSEISGQEFQPTPTSVYRQNVLSLLINQRLAEEAADDLGVVTPPSAYEPPDNAELNALLEALPADELGPFQDYLDTYGRLQALYTSIGTSVSEGSGGAGDADDAAETAPAEGQAYVVSYAEDRDISLDPRFGAFTAGQVVGGSGSLSVAVDPDAKATKEGAAPDVSGLPEAQICQ